MKHLYGIWTQWKAFGFVKYEIRMLRKVFGGVKYEVWKLRKAFLELETPKLGGSGRFSEL